MCKETAEAIQLQEYITKVASNLYDVVASICVIRTIGDNIEGSNSFYAHVQKTMLDSAVLSLNKIFDTGRQSITIEKINSYIDTHHTKMPLKEVMTEANVSDFTHFKSEDLLRITTAYQLSQYLNSQYVLLKELYDHDFNALKELRDRHIAHQDKRSITKITTWDKVDDLVVFVLEYIDLIDFILFRRIWSGDGESPCTTLIESAEAPCRALKRTLSSI